MAKQAKKTTAKKSTAGKKSAAAKTSAAARSRPADVETTLIDTAFELAASRGWRHLSLAEIAAEAGVPLSRALPAFPSKTALLRGFIRRIDNRMLAAVDSGDRGDSARDRLFDVMMARFDALLPYRDGLAAIIKDTVRDPLVALCLMCATATSLAWMLQAAGISTEGPCGRLRIKGLGLVYADTMRVFLRDSSADLSKTMARLDIGLKRAERAAGILNWRGSAADEVPADV